MAPLAGPAVARLPRVRRWRCGFGPGRQHPRPLPRSHQGGLLRCLRCAAAAGKKELVIIHPNEGRKNGFREPSIHNPRYRSNPSPVREHTALLRLRAPRPRKFENFPRRARVLLIPLGPRPIKTKDFAFKTCSNGSPTAEERRSGPACTTDGVQGDAFERESSAPRRQLGLEWRSEPVSDQGLGRVSEGARERRPQLVPASTSSGVESQGGPRPASQGSGVKASDLPTLQWIAPSPGG